MSPCQHEIQNEIVRLTKAAMEAAERGHWGVVIQCYGERGALLEAVQMPDGDANDLLKLDEQICERVHTAQSVLTALMNDATAIGQRLQGIRQRLAVPSSLPGRLSLEA